jgi:hypothetical protein
VCLTNVESFWSSFFFLGSISVFFLIPLFILIVLYTVIAKHLMANPSLISTHSSRSNFLKYRKQVILMLFAVVCSFFTCLLPFKAFTLWIILVPTSTLNEFLADQKSKKLLVAASLLLVRRLLMSFLFALFLSHTQQISRFITPYCIFVATCFT